MVAVTEIIELIRSEVLTEDVEIAEHTNLFSTGFLDSIQLTTLFLSLERHYQVTIGIFDVSQEKFDTPAQIAHWLNSVLNA